MTYIIVCYSWDLNGSWIDQHGTKWEIDRFITYWLRDLNENVIVQVCQTLLWVKAFYSLRMTEWIGPVYCMLGKMLKDIISYFLLFSCFLVIISLIASLLFHNMGEFYDAMYKIFKTSWGTFEF